VLTALKWTDGRGGRAACSRRWVSGLTVTAAVTASALAGCHSNSSTATAQKDAARYSVAGHVRTLVITGHIGDVRVTGGAAVRVSVTQHVVFHGAAPTIRHRFAAGTLSLTSRCAADEDCSVSYDVIVPRATAVRVTDGVGTVRLSALAGQVTVTVDAGQIDLSSLSGQLLATTRAGSIIGQNISSAGASLRVSTGEIDVSFAAPPTSISATNDVGAVILRVPDSVAYHVTTSATVGHIDVTVTQSTSASRTITASTKIGSITIEPAP
jgi:DUF4097 and DUF4098 domain-containing protein YvlB